MHPEEIKNQLEKFKGVKLISLNKTINAYGQISGEIVVKCFEECNLPKDLLDCATMVSQSAQVRPMYSAGAYDAVMDVHSGTTWEVSFNHDRYFIYKLKDAYEKEEWRKANAEMDAFIEGWLGDD